MRQTKYPDLFLSSLRLTKFMNLMIKKLFQNYRFIGVLWFGLSFVAVLQTAFRPEKHNNYMIFKGVFWHTMFPWVGFQQVYLPYTAQVRFAGQTKYTMKKMLHLALVGVTAFSVKPLYFAVFLGFFFSFLSVLYIPYVIFAFINGSEISGWASLIMTIVFFGGLQLIILGIIGIYIGKIFKQTKERPSYIIQEENL